jgi:transcriptional regulator with XRE-family HTH domain
VPIWRRCSTAQRPPKRLARGPPPRRSSDRTRKRRREHGWSATELARRAGVSPGYLSKLERDPSTRPSGNVLGRLVGAEGGDPPPEVPDTRARFAAQARLAEADVAPLVRIRVRGEQPTPPEAWGLLDEALKRAVRE